MCRTRVDRRLSPNSPAGLFEQLTKPPADSVLLHRIELPNEEVAQRLTLAAALNGLKPPSIHRYVDRRRRNWQRRRSCS